MTTATPRGQAGRIAGVEWPLDKGCVFWPRCTTCVFGRCIKELAPQERAELVAAWRTLRDHIALDQIGVR